jgi:hypothetical protein
LAAGEALKLEDRVKLARVAQAVQQRPEAQSQLVVFRPLAGEPERLQ